MPVSGQELASLDFANLIGGPLNAVVESQAKAAITTVNFIKDVAFDDKNMVRTVKFGYTRKNENDQAEKFQLTVPFLTMLPIPYITVTNATIEFNAKITSVNSKDMNDDLKTEVTAGGNVGGLLTHWYASAYLQTKTSYQRKSASSDKEERTFDMHVKVEARNQDMPAGTERLLTILENSISEDRKPAGGGTTPKIYSGTLNADINGLVVEVSIPNGCPSVIKSGFKITCAGETFDIDNDANSASNKVTIKLVSNATPTPSKWVSNANITIKEV